MKNIITFLMVSVFLLTTTSVSADYEKGERGQKGGDKTEMTEKREAAKEALLGQLDDNTRAELEALYEENKAALAELKGDKSEDMSDEEKAEKKAKFETLKVAYQEKVAAVLVDYPEVLEAMQAKHQERWENDESKMKEKRGEWKGDKEMKKWKYKKEFSSKFQSRLENISEDKLEMILETIVSYTTKVEANDNISDEKREDTLSKLEALTEMIQDMVNNTDV